MKTLLGLLFGLLSLTLTATPIDASFTADSTALPKVFMLGEHEEKYEELVKDYETSLLTVCENDMSEAFKKWIGLNQEMETYAEQIEFGIKGLKVWLHVFWKNDGTIQHIGYYLRPDSRNVDAEDLNAFFSSFMNHYKMPLTTDMPYAHYSFVQFPVVSQMIRN